MTSFRLPVLAAPFLFLAPAAAMAALCSGVSVGTSATSDVRLLGTDSSACVISTVNPQQFGGNTSGFSSAFSGSGTGPWSLITGYDGNGNVLPGAPNALPGVTFTSTFTRTTNKMGTWSIAASAPVTLDLVFAMHGANRSGSFLFDDLSLPGANATGTWEIKWVNNGGSVPDYSNLMVFGRDAVVTTVPVPGAALLMLGGLAGLGLAWRRRSA
jgi:hypothetical protein